MSSYILQPQEILYLLESAGIRRPALMTAEDFLLPQEMPPAAPRSDAGILQDLADHFAGPEVVIRVWRQNACEAPRNVWYYVSGGSIASIEQLASGAFILSEISDIDVLLNTLEASLALRPVPEAEDFFCVVDRKDFLDVRDLANVWEEVPALDILEAEGLDKLSARELFDVAAEPEWRAQVNLSGLRDEGNIERVLRVAQGAKSAWMAVPVDDAITRITVETVQAGEIASLLRSYWEKVS